MDNLWLFAFIQGIVEGITEFLPISSTGHLIISTDWLGFARDESRKDFANDFAVFIQFGAILAVVVLYRARLWQLLRDCPRDATARRLTGGMLLAFVPIAVVGLLTHRWIQDWLFNTPCVAIALIVGGGGILVIERIRPAARINTLEELSWRTMWRLGLIQCLALFPGVSRSGATIMGGVCLGLNNKTATEFSFFVAIPTMFAATLYDLFKAWPVLTHGELGVFFFGMVVSGVVAGVAIVGLLRYVQSHSFKVFAYYRIVFGALLLWWVWQRG
ncbi:MAG: undecaprenyl-diphosphate phosphatase [Verrucomicrobia bacterium]|nr:undecaprenyl-diphosphate phosphatase [Verrucomicrobiota bacterium]